MKVEIATRNCEGCPFFRRGAISMIADALAKDDKRTGICNHPKPGHISFLRMRHVDNPKVPPDFCPLRDGETIIKLVR